MRKMRVSAPGVKLAMYSINPGLAAIALIIPVIYVVEVSKMSIFTTH